MSSSFNLLFRRLRRRKTSKDGSLLAQRKRSLTLPLVPQAQAQQTTADQSQSAFFTKLPPEIRNIIYQEVLNGATDVVHVSKKPRKPLELVRCRDRCAMQYNYKCSAGEWRDILASPLKTEDDSEGGLMPLLLACRRTYSEVIDKLYSFYLFDFRSFDAFLALDSTLLPQRWNSIQKIHLKWHFGHGLQAEHREERSKENSAWKRVWKTMSLMQGLREVEIDLDAYLAGDTMSPTDEAEIYEPMMAVTMAPQFVVKVAWVPGIERLDSMPFRLERAVKRRDRVARIRRDSRPREPNCTC